MSAIPLSIARVFDGEAGVVERGSSSSWVESLLGSRSVVCFSTCMCCTLPPSLPLSLSLIHKDAAENIDFALRILSRSLENTPDGEIRPLTLKSEPPNPQGASIEEISRLKLTPEETQQVTDTAFSRLLLSHYRNHLLHLFMVEGMLALCLQHCLPCSRSE